MKKIIFFILVTVFVWPLPVHHARAAAAERKIAEQPKKNIATEKKTEKNLSPLINNSSLPLPRFVATKSDNTYVRTGPAVRYPVKWVFKRKQLPVEVVQEFDHWRKVRDHEGGEGWVHKTLLTGERSVLLLGEGLVPMREGFSREARLLARLEPGVIADLQQCTLGWCRIAKDGYSGWVERNRLWGIYDHEEFD